MWRAVRAGSASTYVKQRTLMGLPPLEYLRRIWGKEEPRDYFMYVRRAKRIMKKALLVLAVEYHHLGDLEVDSDTEEEVCERRRVAEEGPFTGEGIRGILGDIRARAKRRRKGAAGPARGGGGVGGEGVDFGAEGPQLVVSAGSSLLGSVSPCPPFVGNPRLGKSRDLSPAAGAAGPSEKKARIDLNPRAMSERRTGLAFAATPPSPSAVSPPLASVSGGVRQGDGKRVREQRDDSSLSTGEEKEAVSPPPRARRPRGPDPSTLWYLSF